MMRRQPGCALWTAENQFSVQVNQSKYQKKFTLVEEAIE
jgi:hypothetical protein